MGGDKVAIIVGGIIGHLPRYGITFTRLDFPFLYNSRLSPPFRRRGWRLRLNPVVFVHHRQITL